MLNPIAPHMTEELWSYLHADESIAYAKWPTYDEAALVADEIEIILQVNGKLRGRVTVPADADREAMITIATNEEAIQKQLDGAEPKKVIAVPGKLVNFVV
jgi:leucyl-tRNA synthetase